MPVWSVCMVTGHYRVVWSRTVRKKSNKDREREQKSFVVVVALCVCVCVVFKLRWGEEERGRGECLERKNQSCSWCHFATDQCMVVMHNDYLTLHTPSSSLVYIYMCVKLVPFCYRPVHRHNAYDYDYYWSHLYSAILRSGADSLRSHVILHEWIAFYSTFF